MDVYAAPSRLIDTGCFAARDFRKGEVIGEYTGEIISEDEADRRYAGAPKIYLFEIDDDRFIDGDTEDNVVKFINHSCEPNCETVQDGDRVTIRAIKPIRKGEELFYDYHLQVEEDDEDPYTCLCGAPGCRGTMRAAS